MARPKKCTNCQSCMRGVTKLASGTYYICKLCYKVYKAQGLEEVTDPEEKNEVLSRADLRLE